MKTKSQLIFIYIFFSMLLFSQTYEMIDTATFAEHQQLKKKFEAKFENYNNQLKSKYKGKLYRKILDSDQSYQETFVEELDDKPFIFDKNIVHFSQNVFQKIKRNNSSHDFSDIELYVSKDVSPNAACLYEGTLIVNMGLFYYLDNEAQYAAVLSHEIAHKLLNHGEKSIEEREKLELSSDFKEKSKTIKNSKYGKYNKAFKVMKEMVYTNSELSRKREIEADSLGYELFKKAEYNPNEFIASLNILKELDDYQENIKEKQILDTMDYKRLFDLPHYPFDEKWLVQEDFSDYNYDLYKEKIDKDSIRSHPEVEERILILRKNNKEFLKEYDVETASDEFKKYHEIAKYERIPTLYEQEEYGASIYKIIQMMRYEENDQKFLKLWLGNNLDKLYEAKKKYKYNRYVDQINPKEQSKTYVQFLNFMWNLSLNDLKTFAEYYKKNS